MESKTVAYKKKEFEAVYNRNIKRVYQICFLYLKDPNDAADATQSIFEKYLKIEKDFNNEEHEKAWFITVSKNYCKDELKKFWKKKRVNLETIENFPAKDNTDHYFVIDALLKLPPKYKDVLYLYYIEGYSTHEISKLLNCNESTLRNHLSEARRLLKIDLGGYYEEYKY